jgi:transketolase
MKKLTQQELQKISELSNVARGEILKMTTLAQSGHPGGSMSSLDLMMVLYQMININSVHPHDEKRDMVVVSNGHISPAVYSTLGLNDFFDIREAVSCFRLCGSIFEGHIERDVPGVEWGTGNLGQGLSTAVGFALANRLKGINNNIFVFMGDGEQQKGQISEARKAVVKFGLSNITVIIDYNQLQISGDINNVMPNRISDNFLADGWEVIEINGHDYEDIQYAYQQAEKSKLPVLILANTVMGKGVSFMENKEKYHGAPLSEEQLRMALEELSLENNLEELKALRKNFDSSNKFHIDFRQEFNFDSGTPVTYTGKTDNRSAWGKAIEDIAVANLSPHMPLAVFDCDLAGSVKTSGFASLAPANFFQMGIMEHNTATIAGAISAHGIQTFWADFGVFGVDEVINMHRLTDINHGNLKVVVTHVGLDVGEDGKTHQCVDYVGLTRNLYHFGIIVPADPNQTDRATRWLSNQSGNYLMAMGRSKLDILTDKSGKVIFDESYKFEYGKANLLRNGDKAALLVMGTVTGNAVAVADKLATEGIEIQVWNISTPTVLDKKALKEAASTGIVFTYEDHNVNTGLGSLVASEILKLGLNCKLHCFGVEDYAVSGASDDVFAYCKLDQENVYNRVKDHLA